MKKFSSSYMILIVVLGSITITTVLADTVTIGTYPYQIPGQSSIGLIVTSSGTVGIGTYSPAQKLDVNGMIQTEGQRLVVNGFDGSPGNFWIRTGGSEPDSVFMGFTGSANGVATAVTIAPGGTLGIYVPNTGNVGIGTYSPAQKLDVNGMIQTEGQRLVVNGFDGSPGNFWIRTGGSEPDSVFMGFTGSANGVATAVTIAPGGTLGIYVPNTGNVGIGTYSPAQKLDVNGNIRLTGNIVSPNDICIGSC